MGGWPLKCFSDSPKAKATFPFRDLTRAWSLEWDLASVLSITRIYLRSHGSASFLHLLLLIQQIHHSRVGNRVSFRLKEDITDHLSRNRYSREKHMARLK